MANVQNSFQHKIRLLCLVLIQSLRYRFNIQFEKSKLDLYVSCMQPDEGSVQPKARGPLYLRKPIPSMGRKVIDHSSDEGVTESLFSDYYFKMLKGWLYSITSDCMHG